MPAGETAPEPGGTVPLSEDASRLLDLERFAGKVVLVDFWASWCGPCLESFPWMGEILERHGERGLVIVAVNVDEDAESAQAFIDKRPYGFVHIRDPEGTLPEAFGVRAMPTSVLFDRQGQPVYVHEGFRKEDAEHYERHIVALLEGNEDSARATLDLRASRRSGTGVRPWEKGILAQPEMWLDADPLDFSLDDHIYFSKEASSGGRSFGGGGCGCN